MTPQEALGTLHNLVEQMALNGSQRDAARQAAKTLQDFIQAMQRDGAEPAEELKTLEKTAEVPDGD